MVVVGALEFSPLRGCNYYHSFGDISTLGESKMGHWSELVTSNWRSAHVDFFYSPGGSEVQREDVHVESNWSPRCCVREKMPTACRNVYKAVMTWHHTRSLARSVNSRSY